MGFWSSDNDKFGRSFSKRDPNLVELYKRVYFDFGLIPPSQLNEGAKVPVVVNSGFDNKPYAFEVQGTILYPHRFMTRGFGNIFHTISREIPVSRNRVWAFDITRLDEGVLTGEVAFSSDAAYLQSEEYLKILRIIGSGTHKPLSKVPAISLEFGQTWGQYGIPDRISFAMESMHPFVDSDLLNLVNLITHNYHNSNAPVSFSYAGNPATGTMTITAQEIIQPPVVPQHEPQQHAPAPQQEQGDNFPYEFYRGIGLIDEQDRVFVPVCDWMNLPYHMTEPEAKAYLLTYKPTN